MKKAEEILREYIKFDDVNGNETVELLPLTVIDIMEEYAAQFCKHDVMLRGEQLVCPLCDGNVIVKDKRHNVKMCGICKHQWVN